MLCLVAGSVTVSLMTAAVTLAWTHSVEKIAWEEDWRAGPEGLVIDEARVRGSGAGMEPPPQGRLKDGVWAWTPDLPPLKEAVLRRSGATSDYSLCISGQCRPMSFYVPEEADPVILAPCEGT